MSRLEKLLAMLEASPEDEFLNYALAMEYSARGEFDRAIEAFLGVTRRNPLHSAAWFQAAQLQARLGRNAEARAAGFAGVDAARQQGDGHAVEEITGFLDGLP